MGKSVHDLVLDAALDYLSANGNKECVCSTEPTNYTEATATYMLAETTRTSGDYTKANGDTSGRKTTVAAKNGVSVTNTGTAAHLAIVDTVNSRLLAVTTCTSQVLTAGNTVNIPAHDYEIGDPT